MSSDPDVTPQHRQYFWDYLSFRDESKKLLAFTMAALLDKEFTTVQAVSIQLSLFSAWVDKLRALNSDTTLAVLNSVPAFAHCFEALRPTQDRVDVYGRGKGRGTCYELLICITLI